MNKRTQKHELLVMYNAYVFMAAEQKKKAEKPGILAKAKNILRLQRFSFIQK